MRNSKSENEGGEEGSDQESDWFKSTTALHRHIQRLCIQAIVRVENGEKTSR